MEQRGIRSIDDALALTDANEILVEIENRKALKSKMVGTLYPAILQDQIAQLYERWYEVKYNRQPKGTYQI